MDYENQVIGGNCGEETFYSESPDKSLDNSHYSYKKDRKTKNSFHSKKKSKDSTNFYPSFVYKST